MKIPKTLNISGRIYKIILSNRGEDDGISNAGTHYSWVQKIWIDKTQHQEGQESSLIHEIIEAVNEQNDLKLDHQQISVLETSLYQVLKENKLIK